MATITTYYDELGIDPSRRYEAGIEHEIKRAYRHLVLSLHPDRSKEQDTDRLIRVLGAYRVLSDPRQKEKYDQELDDASVDSSSPLYSFNWREAVLFLAECIPLDVGWDRDIVVRLDYALHDIVGKVAQVRYTAQRYCVNGSVIVFVETPMTKNIYVSPHVDYDVDYLTVDGHGNDVIDGDMIRRGDLLVEVCP